MPSCLRPVALLNAVDPSLWSDPSFLRGATSVYDGLRTRLTSDAGATWASLPAPLTLAPGRDPASAAGYPLQLHGPDAAFRGAPDVSYPGAYSAAGAPGFVASTGSIGLRLSYTPADVDTYLSTDGGASWRGVAAGAATYEFGSRGAVVVTAPSGPSPPSATASYSLDGGACWADVALGATVAVANVATQPDNAAPRFVAHGYVATAGAVALFPLDFSALLPPSEWPACGADAYEAWAPAGCVDGAAAVSQRKKPAARCRPADAWVPPPASVRPCGCGPSDVECGYGWERASEASPCTPMPDFAIEQGCPAQDTSPTRPIAGDLCTGNPNNPNGSSQPKKGRKRLGGAAIFFIVLFVLAAVGCCGLAAARAAGVPLPPALDESLSEAGAALKTVVSRLKGVGSAVAASATAARGGGGGFRRGGHDPLDDEAWMDEAASFAPLADGPAAATSRVV